MSTAFTPWSALGGGILIGLASLLLLVALGRIAGISGIAAGSYVTLATYSNTNASSGYVLHTIDLGAYKGQTVQVNFYGVEDGSLQTSFVIDDVSVKTQ